MVKFCYKALADLVVGNNGHTQCFSSIPTRRNPAGSNPGGVVVVQKICGDTCIVARGSILLEDDVRPDRERQIL